ncbi:cytochrome P450 6k1-like isoform X2 [Rhodnius prolixus]|uniref:cytochrome P450 6k1-like isoform X2 n=1 Tax=Rhodnius prolixus TaxID=13249 RepID=UPI003D188391
MLLILTTLLATCCILLWSLSSPFYWKRKGIPYLLPLPLFGSHLPSFLMSFQDFYQKLYNHYPNERYFGLHFFIRPALLIKDKILIKDIFIKDFEYFTSNGMYTNINHDPFGENVLFLHGQAWKEIRLKLSNHFTPSKLRLMNDYVENIMKKVNSFIQKSINENEPIEITKMNEKIATDVIVQAVLGIETDSFEQNSHFSTLGSKMFSSKTNMRLLVSLVAPKLNDLFKINIFEKSVTEFLKNLMKDVIKYRKEHQINKQDFLDAMMNVMKTSENIKEDKYFPDKTKVPEYDFRTVLSQALILIAGGVESAAVTMTFFLYEVSLNQEIQNKCREEIMKVLNETGTDIRTEDIGKLTYMDMVIKETMRKYPPFIMLMRKCTKSYQFRDSNLTIDPGTLILAPVKSIQSDPNNYADPESFIPERFADETKGSIDAGAYLAWGLGPRLCLGKNSASVFNFFFKNEKKNLCILNRFFFFK